MDVKIEMILKDFDNLDEPFEKNVKSLKLRNKRK
jgi:hypothetical protein